MVISMLVIGTISLVMFVLYEWRVAKLPMMPGQQHLPNSPQISDSNRASCS